MGGYVNLLHHDPARRDNLDKFTGYLRDMKTLGARYISTETGSLSKQVTGTSTRRTGPLRRTTLYEE